MWKIEMKNLIHKTKTSFICKVIKFYVVFVFNLLKCALQNQSLKAHYKAGNIFVGFFWQPGVKGCLELPGLEFRTLRFPA